MSALTPQRVFLFIAALFVATVATANYPSARAYARMAFDTEAGHAVLFGGESALDKGTNISYDTDETWIWTGSRWRQVFPLTTPPPRSAHGMAYDSNRGRIVMFGGRQNRVVENGPITLMNDTWIWKDDNWTQLSPQGSPEARHLFSMAYDPKRDKVLLYGGVRQKDATTLETVHDTWELDGTNWTKIEIATPPAVFAPMLAFDKLRNQMMLLGVDASRVSIMFFYDSASRTWVEHKPTTMPDCINDGVIAVRNNGSMIAHGGVCSGLTSSVDETWEWSGTNWFKLDTVSISRGTGMAATYDPRTNTMITFGGYDAFATVPRSYTFLFHHTWDVFRMETRPTPRSLSTFRTDTANNIAWLYGGLNEFGSAYIEELWGYRNQQWFALNLAGAPGDCAAPLSAYDVDRQKLVVACAGAAVFEFSGTEWKSVTSKNTPPSRRFGGMVYDETLKKTVLFGGFDLNGNYRNDTWTWDGVDWTEVKKDRPNNRGLMAMWYDPLQRKTIIYGGLGRNNIDERITRYTDMYAFNGTGWTKLNPAVNPGERMGATVAVHPLTGKLVLFGGLRSEVIDTNTNARRQFYDDDTWIWDGAASTWTQLSLARHPRARQNAAMTWDPVARELVMYGGYSGFYYSDVWAFDGQAWHPKTEGTGRRRSAGPTRSVETPSFAPPGID